MARRENKVRRWLGACLVWTACSTPVAPKSSDANGGVDAGAAPDVAAPARALRQKERRQAIWRLFVAAFLMMQVMMLATPSYVAGPGDLAPDLRQLLNWGSWMLSLPVVWFAGLPFLQGAWRSPVSMKAWMQGPYLRGKLFPLPAPWPLKSGG